MLLTAGARCAFILLALSACVRGHNEHGFLMPDPAGIGFEPVPLNTSFSNLELSVHGAIPSYVNGTLYRGVCCCIATLNLMHAQFQAPGWWPDGWWLGTWLGCQTRRHLAMSACSCKIVAIRGHS